MNICDAVEIMDTTEIAIPHIILKWSKWYSWSDLIADGRSGGIYIPNKKPGVYEVRCGETEERLTIGKASDLRFRVRQALVKGKGKHSSGTRIREIECIDNLYVRWAETERPAAVEEELHKTYISKFGQLPKHTKCT